MFNFPRWLHHFTFALALCVRANFLHPFSFFKKKKLHYDLLQVSIKLYVIIPLLLDDRVVTIFLLKSFADCHMGASIVSVSRTHFVLERLALCDMNLMYMSFLNFPFDLCAYSMHLFCHNKFLNTIFKNLSLSVFYSFQAFWMGFQVHR